MLLKLIHMLQQHVLFQQMSTSVVDCTCNKLQSKTPVHDPVLSAIVTGLPLIILIYSEFPYIEL